MWYELCATIGGIAIIAAIILSVLVFKKKKKQLIPHLLASIAVIFGAATLSSPAQRNPNNFVQSLFPVVSQEPDRAIPSAPELESPSTQPDDADAIQASASATPNPEQLEDMARTYLADTFQLDLAEFNMDHGFEATISIPGVSDQEDLEWAPENWEDIQLSLISAQARLSENLEMPDTPSVLLVKDAAGELLLSVQQGRVAYNALEPEPEPEPTPTSTSTPEPEPEPTPTPTSTPEPEPATIRGRSADTIVYVSSRSNTIHSVHDCSGMKNYRTMTLGNADAKGYKYCPNCW